MTVLECASLLRHVSRCTGLLQPSHLGASQDISSETLAGDRPAARRKFPRARAECHSRSLCGVRTLWLFAWRCRQMARRNFVCAYFGAYLVQRTSDHKRQYFSCEMRKSHTADALGRSDVRNGDARAATPSWRRAVERDELMKHAIVIVNERLAERLQFIALEGLMLMARSRDDSGPGGMAGERVGRSSYRL